MNNKQAQYFEAIYRTGSVSAAAAEFYISRTVVSRSLRDLEEEFGAALFTRTRTGVKLTQAGELLLEHCQVMKASYNLTRNRIEEMNLAKVKSRLKFAITTTTGARLFPDFFVGFMNLCPDVICTVQEMSAYDTIESIRDGSVDAAVTPINLDNTNSKEIEKRFLHTIESVICVSRDSPLGAQPFLTKELIDDIPFITPSTKNPLPFPINIIMRVNQIDLIHKIVSSGICAAVMPRDFVVNWDDVACISMQEPLISKVNIIWKKNVPHSGAFYRFLSYLDSYDISKLSLPD